MFILIQIFEKHLMGNISLHRTVIGPYMRPNMKSKKQSCWEKVILCPGEEVSCLCGLYRWWYYIIFSLHNVVWPRISKMFFYNILGVALVCNFSSFHSELPFLWSVQEIFLSFLLPIIWERDIQWKTCRGFI